jgi:hypothetical protein
LPLLDRWLEEVREHNLMGLTQRRLLRRLRTAETKRERREFIAEALPAESKAKKRSRAAMQVWTAAMGNSCCLRPSLLASPRFPYTQEDLEEPEDTDGLTAVELRVMIARRMGAGRFLPATVQFRTDLLARQKAERPELALPENELKMRLEIAKLLVAAAGTTQAPVSAESACKEIADLFGLSLKVGAKAPAPKPSS